MTPTAIVVHHEGASNGFTSVNEWHKRKYGFISRLGFYAGYQYYIARNGKITQARKETEEGAHTLGGWNRKAVGICLEGNFNITTLSDEQERSLRNLLQDIQGRWEIDNRKIYTHGELWPTECPGRNLQQWIDKYRNGNLAYYEQKILQLRSLIAELISKITKV